MRYKAGHKEETRARILAAAGRGFRRRGFGGIGVDGLAKEAAVTSGAFYGHFPSKEAAFQEAVEAGIAELKEAVIDHQHRFGADWPAAFADFYVSAKRTCDLAESCAMQSLSGDVARAEDGIRRTYEDGMRGVVAQVAAGLPDDTGEKRQGRAWAFLSALAGGVTLARAMQDPELSRAIADATRHAAIAALSS